MRISRLYSAVAVLLILPLKGAQAVPFARFSSLTSNQVRYLGAGAMTAQRIPVTFWYLPGSGVKGTPETGFGPLDARFSFVAVRLGNAESHVGFGLQEMRLFSFSVMLDDPIDGKANLLSGSSTTGDMRGLLGSSTAAYTGSEQSGAAISYTSDFLEFPADDGADFRWVFTGVTPALDITGANFRAFTSGISGDFGYGTPPIASVPEGDALLLFVSSMLPAAALARRRRNSSRANQPRSISGPCAGSTASSSGSGSCSAL